MRKITLFLGLCCTLLAAIHVKAQNYICSGTPISSAAELTTGRYLISVYSKSKEGLLYWSNSSYYFYVSSTTARNKTGQTLDPAGADGNYMWDIVKAADGSFTIQSVKSGKYTSKIGANAEGKGNTLTVEADDVNIGRYAISTQVEISNIPHFTIRMTNGKFEGGSTDTYFHCNGNSTLGTSGEANHLCYWGSEVTSTGDNSCVKMAFYPLTPSISLNYRYNINGVSVTTETKGAAINSEFPEPTLPAFCTASKPTGTVTAEDEGTTKTINVTWNGPFQFTASTDNAVWYHVRAAEAQAVLRNPGGAAAIPLKNSSPTTAENTFTYSTNDQWAFVGDPYNGFRFYNRTQNSSNAYGRLVSSTTMSGTTGGGTRPVVSFDALPTGYTELWDITPSTATSITNGFFMGEHGLPNNRMNSRDNYLAFWTGGAGAGSTFTVTKSMQELPLNAFGENSYATFYTNYPVTLSSADVTAYIGTLNAERNTLDMTPITDNIIPANTGVVLEGNSNTVAAANLTIADAAGDFASNQGSLTGTLSNLIIDGFESAVLVLGPSTDDVPTLGFYQPTVTTIPAYRAYINLNTLGVRGFALHFDTEVTGLHPNIGTNYPSDNAAIYDLSGRRVSKAGKGIYIMGGKKIYVK